MTILLSLFSVLNWMRMLSADLWKSFFSVIFNCCTNWVWERWESSVFVDNLIPLGWSCLKWCKTDSYFVLWPILNNGVCLLPEDGVWGLADVHIKLSKWHGLYHLLSVRLWEKHSSSFKFKELQFSCSVTMIMGKVVIHLHSSFKSCSCYVHANSDTEWAFITHNYFPPSRWGNRILLFSGVHGVLVRPWVWSHEWMLCDLCGMRKLKKMYYAD